VHRGWNIAAAVLASTGCGRVSFDARVDSRPADAPIDGVLGAEIVYPDFNTCPDDLVFNGNATCVTGALEVTPGVYGQVGSVWLASRFAASATTRVEIQLRVDIDVPSGAYAGDGMVVVLQADPRGTAAIGQMGQELGYAGIRPSLAVELDSFNNPGPDIGDNYVGIDVDGSIASVTYAQPPFLMSDGSPFDVWVDYEPQLQELRAFIARDGIKPPDPFVTYKDDLTRLGEFYVGLTASTQGNWQFHHVLEWRTRVMN
jgi:hypothetical protein